MDARKQPKCRQSLNERFGGAPAFLEGPRRAWRAKGARWGRALAEFAGGLGERLRGAFRDHRKLEEGPVTPGGCFTPQSKARQALGRTPCKLYSPFGFESPQLPQHR